VSVRVSPCLLFLHNPFKNIDSMKAETISVGDELLLGLIIDTNSAYLSEKLAAQGITVVRHTVVGDDFDAIVEAVSQAARHADLVIVNGGIGPTVDDVTRQAVSKVAGGELRLDEEWLEIIRGKFRTRNIEMPENNKVQAMLPVNATLLSNPSGTAAGFFVETDGAEIAVFPGVPGELTLMFEQLYLPMLAEKMPAKNVLLTRRLKCYGEPESFINEKIRDYMGAGRNPCVGLLATDAIISVKVTASAPDTHAALHLIDDTMARIRELLGDCVFGEDGDELQDAVARLMVQQKKTLCTAESCTGGMVSERLTEVPGSSAWYLGGAVTYSNEAKTDFLGVPADLIKSRGAVSADVAKAMAEGIRSRMGADYSIAITGIAGPTGGTREKPVGLVFVALSDAAGTDVRQLYLSGSRRQIRDRSAKTALNMLRLKLMQAMPSQNK